jgi:hypothetical protein
MRPHLQNNQSKKDESCDSSGRMPALQAKSPSSYSSPREERKRHTQNKQELDLPAGIFIIMNGLNIPVKRQ